MPPKRAKPKTYERARALRRELTPTERKLWSVLRGDKLNGVNFRRQHAIGKYGADFVAIKKKLIVELDRSHHLRQEKYDDERTKYFESLGYKVIRFWNNAVMNDTPALACWSKYQRGDPRNTDGVVGTVKNPLRLRHLPQMRHEHFC